MFKCHRQIRWPEMFSNCAVVKKCSFLNEGTWIGTYRYACNGRNASIMNCVVFVQTRLNLLVPQNRPCTISDQTSRSSHWTRKVGDNCSWRQGTSVLATSLVRGNKLSRHFGSRPGSCIFPHSSGGGGEIVKPSRKFPHFCHVSRYLSSLCLFERCLT